MRKMVQLPEPFSELERAALLYTHPSPIESLNRISMELFPTGNGPKIWIKREDSNSGLACGGNKIRKLEYIIPDALEKGATILVTTGGLQSNHMRQVAAAGARYGLKVLISLDSVTFSDELLLISTDTFSPDGQSEARGSRVHELGKHSNHEPNWS
jgi:1-aminocyclopropane-1-carboxylate deaminase